MKILITFFLTVFTLLTYSQQISIKFKGPTEIKESFSSNNTGSTLHKVNVEVCRTGNAIPNFDIPLAIAVNHLNTSAADFTLLDSALTITSGELNTSACFDKELIFQVSNDNESTDLGDEAFALSIVPNLGAVAAPFIDAGGIPKVTIGPPINIIIKDAMAPTDSLKFNPFRITVGANFDFEKAVSASLYFDAQMYQPNLWTLTNKKDGFGLGFYGSLYNNKYLTQDSVQSYDKQFYETIGSGDTIDLVRYNYQIGVSNSIKNIGAEAGLTWGFEQNINDDVYVSNTFLFPEISAVHRRITSTYSYDRINVDTLFSVPTPDTLRRLVEREFSTSRVDEFLLGAGYIGRFHSKKYGELMLKFSAGASFLKSTTETLVRPYYSCRFQLLDPKVGINLGGEVRGYVGNASPYFGVYLSKSFGLNKLTEY